MTVRPAVRTRTRSALGIEVSVGLSVIRWACAALCAHARGGGKRLGFSA